VARTAAQIQASFKAPLVGNETSLVAYYKFDSASGTVATNSATATGAAYNGTLNSGPAWVSSSVGLPTVTTLPAVGTSNNVAQLNGTVTTPNFFPATAWFEWGFSQPTTPTAPPPLRSVVVCCRWR